MARMTRPYEDDRAERIAIVDALLLLEWVAYTTPPRDTSEPIRKLYRVLTDRCKSLSSDSLILDNPRCG